MRPQRVWRALWSVKMEPPFIHVVPAASSARSTALTTAPLAFFTGGSIRSISAASPGEMPVGVGGIGGKGGRGCSPAETLESGSVGFFPESGGVFSHTHSCAFLCIFMHFQHFHRISSDCIFHMLHINASLCILTYSGKLHSGMMHSLALIRIFNVAFGTKCIHVHFYASYVGCIFIACCIHVHPMHKMHSCAFLVCCILYMSHCNAF